MKKGKVKVANKNNFRHPKHIPKESRSGIIQTLYIFLPEKAVKDIYWLLQIQSIQGTTKSIF